MAAAVANFQVWRQRQQARQTHERLGTEDDEEEIELRADDRSRFIDTSSQTPTSSSSSNNSTSSETASLTQTDNEDDDDDDDDMDVENQANNNHNNPEEVTAESPPDSPTETTPVVSSRERSTTTRRSVSLADLEMQRERGRQRTSACVLFACFILFRLWIEAVSSGDFGLLLLCLVGTSWTARFIRHTREREEELDRLIAEYTENNGDGGDIRMMSFQAQLALAIMESQRQMMQGGFGHPDGGDSTPGVSDQAMEHWNRFTYKADPNDEFAGEEQGGGSGGEDPELGGSSADTTESSEDLPHCSICLSEYEEGDELVMLPCKHVFHEDCIASWCSNHTRCPLCNFDLESVVNSDASQSEV